MRQKASQTFFGNTLGQQNIIKSISNSFLDFQRLTKTTHFSIFILICFNELQQNLEDILCLLGMLNGPLAMSVAY